MLLIPFLAVYSLFLIYPFFRGIWISLHDWNLLAAVSYTHLTLPTILLV